MENTKDQYSDFSGRGNFMKDTRVGMESEIRKEDEETGQRGLEKKVYPEARSRSFSLKRNYITINPEEYEEE